MKTVYIIMSHSHEDANFDIEFASTDLQKFKGCCMDFDLKLYEDQFKEVKCQDFGWHDYVRYIAYAFDVENPTEHLYALCANGYGQFRWEGVVFGLFKSKEEVRAVLIKKLAKWGGEVDLEEELSFFDKYDTLSDPDMINWSCVRVNLEEYSSISNYKDSLTYGCVCPYCGNGAHWDANPNLKPKSVECNSCGRQLDKIKCAKCGTIHDYVSVGDFCPDCGHKYAYINIKCTNGHTNSYKHRYCTYCGELLNRDESNWCTYQEK